MIAGFKGYINGGAGCGGAGICNGIHFGVRSTCLAMIASTDNNTVPDNNSTDTWVGRSPPLSLCGFFQRKAHEINVLPVHILHASERES